MTTEQINSGKVDCDPWAEKSPWIVDQERREAAEKAAEAAREKERFKAAWVDMTKRPNEWLQIVNRQDVKDSAVRVAVALASFGGNGNTQGVFPTIDTVTEMLPKGRRTVERGFEALREADLIREQSRTFNGPVTYRLGAMPDA
ncbi:hypothetical protein [Streptomyces lancefieldiae]|uniref:Helix-turn-helix domain-containing protein n=1 Tax=Streptomyces lancefieldiae TaxID=3075520 RepID=A0ABU3AQ85_9ACTN|nr:hypothetical protein [Streptomyces sp. DSM 40712]MDT0611985.1 hypothetical protein [Streptomyces sp. DSM 40712]